jgi:hypothetical protein
VPTSPACALATWICEPAGLLALTTLTGYTSRVRRCWPKFLAGGYRRPQVRYERRGDIVLGFLHLACALICLNCLKRWQA